MLLGCAACGHNAVGLRGLRACPPLLKKDYPCISCKVHVKKNDKAVKCSLCDLWIHQACEGMSNETFNVLDTQNRDQGSTYWCCKSCRSYAAKFDKRMKELNSRLQDVEDNVEKNAGEIADLTKQLSHLKTSVDKSSKMEISVQKNATTAVFSEMRERETRRNNVVIHGLTEPPASIENGGDWFVLVMLPVLQ